MLKEAKLLICLVNFVPSKLIKGNLVAALLVRFKDEPTGRKQRATEEG